jgi:hypothetical protein
MRFYRVSYSTMRDSSLGFSWHRSRRDAAAAGRTFRDDNKTEEEVEAVIQPIDIEAKPTGHSGRLEHLRNAQRQRLMRWWR